MSNFFEELKDKKFYFNDDVVINFLLSLKVKPFVIFTGNSGTGKTKLVQLFAKHLENDIDYENFKLIPVGANWTENRHIIGFYNVLTKKYQSTPVLDLIMDSSKEVNKENPYFLILDEMNLSHVERYFSDFLSAIESNEKIPLHNFDREIVIEDNKTIEKEIMIPENLFIIGTVNIDETTYMFSPKVLDRANIIEFESFSQENEGLSIKDYMFDTFAYNEILDDAIEYLENPLSNLNLREFNIIDLKNNFDNDYIWEKLSVELNKFNKALKKSNFDFGFRTINEILSFMYVAKEFEKRNNDPAFTKWEKYFDVQIKQKMLPKLHGSEILLDTLECLLKYCLKTEKENDDPTNLSNYKYKTSAKKIIDMINLLEKQKYVSFIN